MSTKILNCITSNNINNSSTTTTTKTILPIISFNDPQNESIIKLCKLAQTTGIAFIKDLPFNVNFGNVQNIFDKLLSNQLLSKQLNDTYPKRGVFKTSALSKSNVDQKFTIDLSVNRLKLISNELRDQMNGDNQEFNQVIEFFENVHSNLLPLLLSATSEIIGKNLAAIHSQQNVNYRLCDYPTVNQLPSIQSNEMGCSSHSDYGTVTIIFQNEVNGLEYFDELSKSWVLVPANTVVVLWGQCSRILSNDKIVAVKHRVVRSNETFNKRRNTAILFIAPNLNTQLSPLNINGDNQLSPFNDDILSGKYDVNFFKDILGRKWRGREGNYDENDNESSNYDDNIDQFLYK
ncbi:hypothetical protein ACTA71_003925 [Dictyostelium dimigraforme]